MNDCLISRTSTPLTSSLRRGKRISRFFVPALCLARDLMMLSAKVMLAVIAASVRLVVPPWKKRLLGETVLITGAGHGIGRELAVQLAALGCIVVCWDCDANANRETISFIARDGGEAHGFMVDVSKYSMVQEAAQLMKQAGIPEISILINSAAILMHKPFIEHKDDDIERIFHVNVLSQFWTIHTFLPTMLHNNKGHIVSMSSSCGFYGVAYKVPYCSSKFALKGLMEGLCEELRATKKSSNIQFTTIYPFYVDTDLAKDPKFRFPYLFSAVPAKYAASEVIRAIQRNYEECSIPRCLSYLNAVNRILPAKAMRLILDFLGDVK
ncbi:estradiol 17-beta-dehydrogenase 11-like [Phymastichus coffea]|uniref:estradiol 17-beta-dehydrogenase 11-like n=1 Tax=Phymastichus coffea TaxID=108790 RepID=UPI00273C5D2F|nr:estradiol 17-beta-dehydrogenase 11-like [Phymastichus coffea]